MAYFLLSSYLMLVLLLVSTIQTVEPATLSINTSEPLLPQAIRILSEREGYSSMALTLELASHTLTFPDSPRLTIFAPSDGAFINSGQPSLNLLQYHIATEKHSIISMQTQPYGTKIPTLLPNQSLLLTSSGKRVSINGVRIKRPDIWDYSRTLAIFGVDEFFDMSYQITGGCKGRLSSDSGDEFENEIAKASAVMLSRGYSIMSSALNLQLHGLMRETTHLTIFAVTDSVLAPYSMNLSLASVFHRHFLPCKLAAKDIFGLTNTTTLRTMDKDFTLQVLKSGVWLYFNDVPVQVFFSEMYSSDSIVVHGLNQIIV